ncbi:uncharacterized protein LOC125235488 [Leguminivora glycinivorella]|uniref:uncharacterized protein LOC125235488 n=1 Tax=Leguminivora glycinivorella TaxID=1035111 RepID=UPI00200CF9D9|nr:uncharacterized protein LOC125235488 [Leguminivora glycinivorella]
MNPMNPYPHSLNERKRERECERGHGRHISVRSVLLPKLDSVFCVKVGVFSWKNGCCRCFGVAADARRRRGLTRGRLSRNFDVSSPLYGITIRVAGQSRRLVATHNAGRQT